jgi:hypothetical protein
MISRTGELTRDDHVRSERPSTSSRLHLAPSVVTRSVVVLFPRDERHADEGSGFNDHLLDADDGIGQDLNDVDPGRNGDRITADRARCGNRPVGVEDPIGACTARVIASPSSAALVASK